MAVHKRCYTSLKPTKQGGPRRTETVNEPLDQQSRFKLGARSPSESNRAFETYDLDAICQATGDAVRLHNVSDVARIAGLKRTSIYRALGCRQLPSLSTVVAVLKAIGFQLKVTQLQGKRARDSKTS
jgi:probable addiction module antidote protein